MTRLPRDLASDNTEPLDDDCIHGLPPQSCTICLHPYRGPEPVTVEHIFPAGFDGHCPGCNLPISVGQMLCKLSTGFYVHQWCAP